jgi:hypothetical protein
MMKRAQLLFCLFALAILVVARDARAQQQPASPAMLPGVAATYVWSGMTLRASFKYREIVDNDLANNLTSGLPTTFAMLAWVVRESDQQPVALAARQCRVVYDLWDDVYRLKISERNHPDQDRAAYNLDGVLRVCAEARDLDVVTNRASLQPGAGYFLAVEVDVNPISQEMLEQMRRWVSRPSGSTDIGPGDSLFNSFAGLFVRQIGTADKTLRFRTPRFTG